MPHPADPDRYIWVPLRYDRQAGSWVPIKRRGYQVAFLDGREAIRCALEHAREDWGDIIHKIRVVRVLSQHCGDGRAGADAEMISREVGTLAKLADPFDENLAHLLSVPGVEHSVEVDVAKLVVVDDLGDG